METGVVYGRFHVLNLKHMEYILAAKMRCERLFIGIEEPEVQCLFLATRKRHANFTLENPLTYLERYEMICKALLEFGAVREDFEIVPFPMAKPEYLLQYAPKDGTYFLTIAEESDKKKKKELEKLGLEVEVLWSKNEKERGFTDEEVLEMIMKDEDWSVVVPKSTYQYMKDEKVDQRIKELAP